MGRADQRPGGAAAWGGLARAVAQLSGSVAIGSRRGVRRRLKRLPHRLHRGVYAVGHLALGGAARATSPPSSPAVPPALLEPSLGGRSEPPRAAASDRIEVTVPRTVKPKAGIIVHSTRVLEPDGPRGHRRDPGYQPGPDHRRPGRGPRATPASCARSTGPSCSTCSTWRRSRRRLARLRAGEAGIGCGGFSPPYRPEPTFTAQRRGAAAPGPVPRARPPHARRLNTWLGEQEVDLYWPDARLAVEFDGREAHGTHAGLPPRIAGATGPSPRRASRSLRVTAHDLGDTAALAAELQAIRADRLPPLTSDGRARVQASTPPTRPSPTSPRRAPRWPRGSRRATASRRCSASPGSGKTATMAFAIEQVQRPALVIAHNKTLAAQLCNEFREFFPENAVEYFVSYYDYYQPEAYVPSAGPLHREGLLDQPGDRAAAARGHGSRCSAAAT